MICRRTTFFSLVCAAACLLHVSCGHDAAQEAPPRTAGGEAARAGLPTDPHAHGAPDEGTAGIVPVPELPESAAPAQEPRRAPTIGTIEDLERAFEAGFYEEVERAIPGLAQGATNGRALLVRARLEMVRGRYDDAARTAEQAARQRDLRVRARTLQAEALIARGRLDEAERTLTPVASDPTAHRARVVLGRLLLGRGRKSDAETWLMQLVQAYNDGTIASADAEGMTYVALAARALGSVQDANEAFQEATRADAARVETQLEWAQLFLEKYDTGHAEESVMAALQHNPENPAAHALLARIKLEQTFDFVAAGAELDRAFAVNPNLVEGHVTLAGMALRDLDFAQVDRHLARALEVNPNDLQALSVRAAARFVASDDQGFEAAIREVLRRNPTFSRVYSVVGEYADWEHRYPEIVLLARRAIALDAEDAFAHATLGLNLLRIGDEQAGLTALREAWQLDRHNVHVYNTLNLYDDVIPQQYEDFEASPFVFRMDKQEKPILERYVPALLRRGWRSMVERYGFTPQGPVRIELYADTEHFSVRTSGLPNLGVQGVCFGKVVTAISPRGGPFNWAQITWHELAHVFHIQLSRNRVPRWFTEGLAEYETIVARPEWRREEDHRLWRALESNRLPPLRLLNQTFTHARSAEDMMTAYYTSSMVVVYIVERFGFPKAVAMLRGWGAGQSTPDVIQRALGISIDDLDRDFREHTRRRLASHARDFGVDFEQYADLDARKEAAARAPTDLGAQAALAAALLVADQVAEATQTAERVIAASPGQALARFVLARVALQRNDGRAAATHLRALIQSGTDGYEVRLLLARVAMLGQRPDLAVVRRELEAAARIDGERGEAWSGLAEVAERSRDGRLRLEALLHLARIDQHDREANGTLLSLLAQEGRWNDVLTFGEIALHLDPARAESHRLLAEAYLRANRARDALYEFDSVLVLGPEHPAPAHLGRARALRALGQRAEAQSAAREAIRLDPALRSEAADLLR